MRKQRCIALTALFLLTGCANGAEILPNSLEESSTLEIVVEQGKVTEEKTEEVDSDENKLTKETTTESVREETPFEFLADYNKADVVLKVYPKSYRAELWWDEEVRELTGEDISYLYDIVGFRDGITLTVCDMNGDGEDDVMIKRNGYRNNGMHVILHGEDYDGSDWLRELPVVPTGASLVSKIWLEGNTEELSLYMIFCGEERAFVISDEYIDTLKKSDVYFDEEGNLNNLRRPYNQSDNFAAVREQSLVEEDGVVYFVTKEHFMVGLSWWTNVWVEAKYRLYGTEFELVDVSFGSEDYTGW